MCFTLEGAKAPNIVYQGPSQADIDRNRASLDKYESDMATADLVREAGVDTAVIPTGSDGKPVKKPTDHSAMFNGTSRRPSYESGTNESSKGVAPLA